MGLLDWGLGHTTRCIPLLKYLQKLHCKIYIAAAPAHKLLLSNEIEGLIFLDGLPLYNISYQGKGKLFLINLAKNAKRIFKVIKDEKSWLEEMHRKFQFDFVVSDNRYGFYLTDIPSVIITHQLSPQTGLLTFLDNLVRIIHYRYLTKFSTIWVPDFETKFLLSGSLGHPKKRPSQVKYIGPLSRFEPELTTHFQRNLLIVLSGPEPQRTLLEEILQNQLQNYEGKYLLVRGLPGAENQNLPHTVAHLTASNLVNAINTSEMVICRSGYSSIMDLIKLQKKAILIPTPGQTEQEYLAKKLFNEKMFLYAPQHQFNIMEMLAKAKDFPFQQLNLDFEHFQPVVKAFVNG